MTKNRPLVLPKICVKRKYFCPSEKFVSKRRYYFGPSKNLCRKSLICVKKQLCLFLSRRLILRLKLYTYTYIYNLQPHITLYQLSHIGILRRSKKISQNLILTVLILRLNISKYFATFIFCCFVQRNEICRVSLGQLALKNTTK